MPLTSLRAWEKWDSVLFGFDVDICLCVTVLFRIPEGRSAGPPNNDVEDDLVEWVLG